MSSKKKAPPPLGAVERAVLGRISEARAAYLHANGRDLLWSDIGRTVGWTQPTMSAVKNGKRAIRLGEIPAIARALGVREAWLALGEGAMRAGAATPVATPGGPVERVEDAVPDVPPPAHRERSGHDRRRRA